MTDELPSPKSTPLMRSGDYIEQDTGTSLTFKANKCQFYTELLKEPFCKVAIAKIVLFLGFLWPFIIFSLSYEGSCDTVKCAKVNIGLWFVIFLATLLVSGIAILLTIAI